jgi:hypothetical protein
MLLVGPMVGVQEVEAPGEEVLMEEVLEVEALETELQSRTSEPVLTQSVPTLITAALSSQGPYIKLTKVSTSSSNS